MVGTQRLKKQEGAVIRAPTRERRNNNTREANVRVWFWAVKVAQSGGRHATEDLKQ
jgi:hypothetical protein